MNPLLVCKALCDHQKGLFPVVFVSTRQLAEELGMDRRHVQRDIRLLVRRGLLHVVIGGGRQAAPRGRESKANTYSLGPACGRRIEALLHGASGGAVSGPDSAPPMAPYRSPERSQNGATHGALNPSGLLRNPPGDRGKRTAGSRRRAVLSPDALIGQPSQTPPGLRGLFGDLSSTKERRRGST